METYGNVPIDEMPLPKHFLIQQLGRYSTSFCADRDRFETAKGRRSSIRHAIVGEFENSPLEFRFHKPPLHVLVCRTSPSLHVVIPVWRGREFFPVKYDKTGTYADVRNDDENSSIVQLCESRGGYDKAAWDEFLATSRGML